MPLLAGNVVRLVLAIAAIILLGTGFLIAVAIGRRFERERYFRRLDALRARYGHAVHALLAGRLDHKFVLDRLRSIGGRDRASMLERLCLEQKPTPARRPALPPVGAGPGLRGRRPGGLARRVCGEGLGGSPSPPPG